MPVFAEHHQERNLSGGDQVLRDAEHYLFRYWLASESKMVTIPDGLPVNIPSKYNPTLVMHPFVMKYGHDPAHNNVIRPAIGAIAEIAPATSQMELWEQRGYQEGYCASGDCQRDASSRAGQCVQSARHFFSCSPGASES